MTEIEHTGAPASGTPAGELDDAALDSWSSRAAQRRSSRKRRGLRGAWDEFTEWPLWQRLTVAVPSALVALAVLLVAGDALASAGRVHPGVHASGVSVGGLSVAKATARLDGALSGRVAEPVTVSFEKSTWKITGAQLGASVDATAGAKAAYAVGRTGSLGQRIVERAAAWVGAARAIVPVTTDASLTAGVIDGVASGIEREPKDATVVIENMTPRIEPAGLGIAVRRDELHTALTRALISDDRTVEVGVDFVPVRVTDAGAKQALADAEAMISGPVSVVYGEKRWEFPATDVASWVAFRPVETTSTAASSDASSSSESSKEAGGQASSTTVLEAFISAEETSKTITPHVGEAGTPAVDATFKVSGGKVTIVPSQDGTGPDMEALAREMTVVLKGGGERSVQLRTQRVQPQVTTDAARNMGIKERISSYTTTYDAGNKPRVNNIHTLADAINGTLIAPGATFSFNGTVGPRTAAKGYQEAPAIVNGKLVPQLGGGICQVGTTIFNAVFESGLPVVERKNHSFYISHYPKGRDATVSWGGPDFKFRNDTSNWVLVATGYTSGSLTISLYGTDPGYEVEASAGPWTDIKPHTVEEVPDPLLATGKRVVEDSGVDGRTIIVTRTVKKNGAVVRQDSFKSVYKPKVEVVRVGTAPVPGQTATTTP